MYQASKQSNSMLGIVPAVMLALVPANTNAQTAGDVMTKMSAREQSLYMSGVVEGLAHARWLKDKPDVTGANCIYDWYFKGGKEKHRRINQWFERHPEKGPGILLHVLVKQECGE